MPLRIDTSKCKDYESFTGEQNYDVATLLYAVGIGQITEDNYGKVYKRAAMLNLAGNRPMPDTALATIKQYIGCHTNVSDESDFKFSKKVISSMNDTVSYLLMNAEVKANV